MLFKKKDVKILKDKNVRKTSSKGDKPSLFAIFKNVKKVKRILLNPAKKEQNDSACSFKTDVKIDIFKKGGKSKQ